MTGALLTCRSVVYPWDCDHMGHANVAWYVRKFDEATWALLADVGLTSEYLSKARRCAVAVDQRIAYRRELLPGDLIVIRSAMLKAGRASMQFVHEMTDGSGSALIATTLLTGVHMDAETRTSCPVPDEIRARIDAKRVSDPTVWDIWPPSMPYLG